MDTLLPTTSPSPQFLDQIESLVHIGGWEIELPSQKVYWSPELFRIHGVSQDFPLTVDSVVRFYTEESAKIVLAAVERAIYHQEPFDLLLDLVDAQGTRKAVRTVAICRLGPNGKPLTLYGTIQDVTERKRLNDRLRESEQQLSLLFENTGTANSLFDTNCRLIRQNAASVAQLGLNGREATGKHVVELFGEQPGRAVVARMQRVLDTGVAETFDTRFQLSTGSKWFRSTYQPIVHEGTLAGLQVISQDITEQVNAQQALRDQELQFRTFFELAADVVCIAGLDGTFQAINPAGKALLKYDDDALFSQTFLNFVHPEDRESTVKVISHNLTRGETIHQFQNRCVCADGSLVWLEWVIRPDLAQKRFYAVARDVTARRKFEAEQGAIEVQIRRTQKLESLGILAGGLAHDFNNILAGILSFVELAELRPQDDKTAHYLQKIEEGCWRAQGLTRQLLTFAKGGVPVMKSIDPGTLVENTVQFASHGSTSRVAIHLEPNLPLIACDPEQIDQVVSNLVINALQAMEGSGTLEVTVGRAEGGVLCRFTDTGPGIPSEFLDQIFDPFFTTKKSGTGLGLSICHSIVKSHAGTLTVDSVSGQGTTFLLTLPAARDVALDDPPRGIRAYKGHGRALVLDDDEPILMAVTEILATFGFEAEAVDPSQNLLDVFDSGEIPSLCLLDLTIPGKKGGATWAKDLRERGYQGVLVAMSGYSTDPVLARPRDFGFDAALAKPFRTPQLAQLLHLLSPH